VDGGTPGADYSFASDVLTILSATPMTIGMATPGAPTTQRIVIGDGTPSLTANITLNGVSIDLSENDGICALEVDGAHLNLTLAGASTLESGGNRAGLQLNHGGSLTITEASGTATLEAVGGDYGAGIGTGGPGTGTGGSIEIKGGDITARVADASGSGIGAGREGGALIGDITISGGKVAASAAATWGCGIGRDEFGFSQEGDIVITGGTVEAHAAYYGSGIGGSIDGNIKISGSAVIEAYGGGNGAGIGGALSGDLVISGGTITARGGNVNPRSDGIGLNGGSSASRVLISNATVTATGGVGRGAGIYGRTVIIDSGTIEARGTDGHAGIDSAWDSIPDSGVGTITINGGRIEAYGSTRYDNGAAGIGGSCAGSPTFVSAITINGGTIKAVGGANGNSGAPGVGRATNGWFIGALTINGGTIIAEGGGDNPDIETQVEFFGNYYGGPIVINGGSIWADELNPAPVNSATPTPTPQPVFANTLTLGSASEAPDAAVIAAAIDGVACATTPDANTGVYGIRDVWTNAASAVCFWLPTNPAANAGVGLSTTALSYELSYPRDMTAQIKTLSDKVAVDTVLPAGDAQATAGVVTVRFSVAMDTATSGTVRLIRASGATELSGGIWSDDITWTIPYGGLAFGTAYTIELSGFRSAQSGLILPLDVSHVFYTVDSLILTISPSSKDFGSTRQGYGPITPQLFTLTNTGTATLSDLTATLSGADASAFEITTALSVDSLASGESTTMGIRPKAGLAARTSTYGAALDIAHGSASTTPVSAALTFTVKDKTPTPTPPTPNPPQPQPPTPDGGGGSTLPPTADTAALPLAAAALLAACGLGALARSMRSTRPMRKGHGSFPCVRNATTPGAGGP
jgi:hypothetical protein